MASSKLAERLESAEADDDVGTGSRWRFRPWLAALTALLLALAGACGYFGWHYVKDRQIANSSAAALNTASTYAVTLTSVDTDNLDANFAAVLDGSTGDFHDMYAKSSSQLRKLLVDHKATGHGVVVNSAVKSATTDEVVVLLFVDQTVTNTEVPDPRVDRSRMVMTMQNVDGRWKAANVELP
ncbi:Mce protein [Mycobacterium syngnathidarum]